jgi:Arc/MetJ family transcription regulator
MKIIQVTEGAEVVNATSTSIVKETIETILVESLPEEVEEPPRPWPHDGVVRSWAY